MKNLSKFVQIIRLLLIYRLLYRFVNTSFFLLKTFKDNIYTNKDFDSLLLVKNKFNLLYWIFSDTCIRDQVYYQSLKKFGLRPKVLFNPQRSELLSIQHKFPNKNFKVFYNPHHFWFSSIRPKDYPVKINSLVRDWEEIFGTSNILPSSDSILYWENKRYMHTKLSEYNIPHPRSSLFLLSKIKSTLLVDHSYPYIIKSLDGYSSNGIWKINSQKDLSTFIDSVDGINDDSFIVQKFLNISFDIRVICSFGKVISFYWRKNSTGVEGISPNQDEWRPTATQNGSTVQFFNLPECVEELARSIYQKTGTELFGTDICFEDNDLESQPYVLEFSPVFQPNPIPNSGIITDDYAQFKKYDNGLGYEIRFRALNQLIFEFTLVNLLMKMKI